MIDTFLSLFGIGQNFVSSIHQSKSIKDLEVKLNMIDVRIEKLSENI